jgi:hypothetical protein
MGTLGGSVAWWCGEVVSELSLKGVDHIIKIVLNVFR